jgi:hypothetical protein
MLMEKFIEDNGLLEIKIDDYIRVSHQINMSMSKLLIKDQLIQFKLLLELMTF